jgi:4-alpha-glucanotransferase
MNMPGTSKGNWRWRLRSGQLSKRQAARLRELTERHGRFPG